MSFLQITVYTIHQINFNTGFRFGSNFSDTLSLLQISNLLLKGINAFQNILPEAVAGQNDEDGQNDGDGNGDRSQRPARRLIST